jgi:hypothetical protein
MNVSVNISKTLPKFGSVVSDLPHTLSIAVIYRDCTDFNHIRHLAQHLQGVYRVVLTILRVSSDDFSELHQRVICGRVEVFFCEGGNVLLSITEKNFKLQRLKILMQ